MLDLSKGGIAEARKIGGCSRITDIARARIAARRS
jgi:hypothetical protein